MTYTGPDPGRIRSMFAAISGRYDRANTVLSGGIHHLWRRTAVDFSGVREGDSVLDCATGTGDLAIAFANKVGPRGKVIGTDFVPEMIALARQKAPSIAFEVADVTALPYADDSFDVASISFGIRNVGDPRKGIAELARVVRPGGRVVIVEFGQPPRGLFRTIYDLYRRTLLPLLGGAVTGDRAAYEYLESSTAKFPSDAAFVAMMEESAKFVSIEYRPLTFGIAYVYRGVVA
jgi:demethylmenaquinone methyltransferase/2-methoxy-6-polyprenyl-1,4-benzoquinol methylase